MIFPSNFSPIDNNGVIKKFVDVCDEINTNLAILKNFLGNITQQMFFSCENQSQIR